MVGTYSNKERKEPKDKWTRAFKVTHYFENGKVYLKSRKLIEQLVVFPTGDLDDLVDITVYALLMINDYVKKTAVFSEKKKFSILGAIQSRDVNFEPPPRYVRPKYSWKTAL